MAHERAVRAALERALERGGELLRADLAGISNQPGIVRDGAGRGTLRPRLPGGGPDPLLVQPSADLLPQRLLMLTATGKVTGSFGRRRGLGYSRYRTGHVRVGVTTDRAAGMNGQMPAELRMNSGGAIKRGKLTVRPQPLLILSRPGRKSLSALGGLRGLCGPAFQRSSLPGPPGLPGMSKGLFRGAQRLAGRPRVLPRNLVKVLHVPGDALQVLRQRRVFLWFRLRQDILNDVLMRLAQFPVSLLQVPGSQLPLRSLQAILHRLSCRCRRLLRRLINISRHAADGRGLARLARLPGSLRLSPPLPLARQPLGFADAAGNQVRRRALNHSLLRAQLVLLPQARQPGLLIAADMLGLTRRAAPLERADTEGSQLQQVLFIPGKLLSQLQRAARGDLLYQVPGQGSQGLLSAAQAPPTGPAVRPPAGRRCMPRL